MVKLILTSIGVATVFSSCSMFKSLNMPGSKEQSITEKSASERNTRFIEDISVSAKQEEKSHVKTETAILPARKGPSQLISKDEVASPINNISDRYNPSNVETAGKVQLKYAILLNTEVEALPSKTLLENVDEWYGVRYRVGGNSKTGVDCSGFTVAVYAAVYGVTLPRVSRDQYQNSRKISTTELQEGDLVFFNTRGNGVSHVGIYLGNNHFIHASVSRGVMVNSLFEPYYLQRFVGAGRIDQKQVIASTTKP